MAIKMTASPLEPPSRRALDNFAPFALAFSESAKAQENDFSPVLTGQEADKTSLISPLDAAVALMPKAASIDDALMRHKSDDPLHLLFPEKIINASQRFNILFDGDILFAVKANPSPEVLRLAWLGGIKSFDVASLREVKLVKRILPFAKMAFMHPVKSREAIREAYRLGVRTFAFDHEDELAKIEAETHSKNGKARDLTLVLRIAPTPHTAAAYSLSGKFGVGGDIAVRLLQKAHSHLHKLGISFHVGSQCMDPSAFKRAIDEAASITEAANVPLEIIDLGGGFPVAYPGMTPPPLEAYMAVIDHSLRDHRCFDGVRRACEPGRALVAEAGAVLVRVELRRHKSLYLNDGTYGSLFDAGLPAWSFPMSVLRPVKHQKRSKRADHIEWLLDTQGIASSDHESQEATGLFDFFGPTCDSLDHMKGPFSLSNAIREGDWILISHIGAYGHTLQTHFNGFYSKDFTAIIPSNFKTATNQ